MLGDQAYGISPTYTRYMALEIKKLNDRGVEVAVVVGGGNFIRGADTAAALRAAEIDADVILMAKHGVDGVYSADPKLDKSARKYDELTYGDVLARNLRIIDATAAAHANERRIPAIVFDLNEPDALVRAVQGERVGTLVTSD